MTHNQQLVIIFAALLAASPALASTVVRTTTQDIQGEGDNGFSETFSFPNVANADELISISNGSVSFAEGGNLTISVDYSSGASAQIFSSTYPFGDVSLTSITSSPFAPGTIDGFTFALDGGFIFLDIPSGTAFDIDASVPEPATWVTMLAGFGLVGAVMRSARRTRRVRGGDLRTELRILP